MNQSLETHPQCGNCRFADYGGPSGFRICKRNAPSSGSSDFATWPKVFETNVCGEFKITELAESAENEKKWQFAMNEIARRSQTAKETNEWIKQHLSPEPKPWWKLW